MSTETADPLRNGGGYRKSRFENFILRGIYDIFIAPVCAAFATVAVIAFELIVLGLSTAFPFLIIPYYFSDLDEAALTKTSLSISTVCSIILAVMLPNTGSFRLALPVGLSTATVGLLCVELEMTSRIAMSLCCAGASTIAAILYWFLLEDRSNSSISRVLTNSYASMSALNQKPKDIDSKKTS